MPNSLGDFMRAARKTRGFSINVLADRLNVAGNTLGAYERGERLPEPDFLAMFATYTGASFATLLWERLKQIDSDAISDALAILSPLGPGPSARQAIASPKPMT
ncbi:MAG: helix-turn-helix transcriptional regulator, partial [Proteobacteria bacterium]|nr:helix-turn-helix transcriptional regulator [Pseudomonadota bacterium]